MASGFHLIAATLSHPGRKRPDNEDSAASFESVKAEDWLASGDLYIVADGVGGAAKGEKASSYAAQKVLYDYYRFPSIEPGERLQRLMRQAGNEIFDYAERSGEGAMATTMVAVAIQGENLIVASVGDSRVYLIRGGVARQLTEDHTDPGKRNRLTRSLGGEQNVEVDVFSDVTLKLDDKILLCSDGLTRYVDCDAIVQLTAKGTPEEIVERLINHANDRGGVDNITATLIAVGPPATTEEIIRARALYITNQKKESVTNRQTDAPDQEPQLGQNTPASSSFRFVEMDTQPLSRKMHLAVFVGVSMLVVLCGMAVITITQIQKNRMASVVYTATYEAASAQGTQIRNAINLQSTQAWASASAAGTATSWTLQTADAQQVANAATSTGEVLATQIFQATLDTYTTSEAAKTEQAKAVQTQDTIVLQTQAAQTGTAIYTPSETITLAATSLPVQQTGKSCVVEVEVNDTIDGIFIDKFNLPKPTSGTYYPECNIDTKKCNGVPQTIIDLEAISVGWWIIVPVTLENLCTQGGGIWIESGL